jgi:hypothetical protein
VIENSADALRSWIETAREFGDPILPPLHLAMEGAPDR